MQAYQATGNPTFLSTAENIANYFFTHLPKDFVPYWDFDAPVTPTTPRDTSAAAIAADGLIMLSTVAGGSLAATYLREAKDILGSLSSSYLDRLQNDPAHDGLAVLIDGSDNVPSNNGVDTSLIWGDYFFTEALLRLRNDLHPQWTLYDPAVPEPSIWAMMLIGFAGLGLAGYRASRQRAPVAA